MDNNSYGTSNQGFSNQVSQPPPDSIAEFQVVTNNMSAEFGRSGGATINVANGPQAVNAVVNQTPLINGQPTRIIFLPSRAIRVDLRVPISLIR